METDPKLCFLKGDRGGGGWGFKGLWVLRDKSWPRGAGGVESIKCKTQIITRIILKIEVRKLREVGDFKDTNNARIHFDSGPCCRSDSHCIYCDGTLPGGKQRE